LDLYKKENLLDNIRQRAAQMAEELNPLHGHPHVKEIRQIGLMVGIELTQTSNTPYPPQQRMGLKVCDAAFQRGLWLRPLGDTIVLMPPLAISAREMTFLTSTVRNAIDDVTENGG